MDDPDSTAREDGRRGRGDRRGHKATLNKGTLHPLNLLSTFDVDWANGRSTESIISIENLNYFLMKETLSLSFSLLPLLLRFSFESLRWKYHTQESLSLSFFFSLFSDSNCKSFVQNFVPSKYRFFSFFFFFFLTRINGHRKNKVQLPLAAIKIYPANVFRIRPEGRIESLRSHHGREVSTGRVGGTTKPERWKSAQPLSGGIQMWPF